MPQIVQARQFRTRRAPPLLFVVFGLAFIVFAVLAGQRPVHLQRVGLSAPGTVVNQVWHAAKKGGRVSHPVVRFTSADGRSIQFEDRVGTSPPLYQVGEAVSVLYEANWPAGSAMIDRGIWNLLPSFIFGAFGLLFVALGTSIGLHRHPASALPSPDRADVQVSFTHLSDALAQAAAAVPRGHWQSAIALSVVALALALAPPSHKTGDAAIGVLLCVMAGVVAAFYAVASFFAAFVSAGLGAAAATRSGADRGLSEASSGADWSAAADQSPAMRAWQLHYAHFRRALWLTGMAMLLGGIGLMGIAFLTHIAASP